MLIKLDLFMVVIIKVDQDGFFISWKSEGREAEVLDLSQVIRPIIDNKLMAAQDLFLFLIASPMHWTSFAEHCHTSYQVNDIRPGADPLNERIRSQLVAKHGQDFKSKVVNRCLA